VAFALPTPDELPAARDTVHAALYLLFNEGHLSTSERPILEELCASDGAHFAHRREPSLATSDTRPRCSR